MDKSVNQFYTRLSDFDRLAVTHHTAHKLNNLLTSISVHQQMLELSAEEGDISGINRHISEIGHTITELREYIKQLWHMFPTKTRFKEQDVIPVIESSIDFFKSNDLFSEIRIIIEKKLQQAVGFIDPALFQILIYHLSQMAPQVFRKPQLKISIDRGESSSNIIIDLLLEDLSEEASDENLAGIKEKQKLQNLLNIIIKAQNTISKHLNVSSQVDKIIEINVTLLP